MEKMKAVRIHSYGGPEVLVYEDSPRPTPNSDQLLIKIHAAGVNPVDWKFRKGMLQAGIPRTLPAIPGWDFSGVVESVGDAVTIFKKGDEVFGRPSLAQDGTYADYALVLESDIAKKPRTIDHVHAASIPIGGLTAWQALFDLGDIKAGQRILIHGAAGGVGNLAVQLAHWQGAHVIGTASKINHTFLKNIGADELVDYNTTRFEKVVHDVDMVFDTVGGETQGRSWGVLKKGGILVSIVGLPTADLAAGKDVRRVSFMAKADSAQLAQMAELVDAGRLTAIVSLILPLAEARRAHELSEGGHVRGKIVLRVV